MKKIAVPRETPDTAAAVSVGRHGEQLALEYLRGLGWDILDTHWCHRLGEIDIIARDGNCHVLVEVKTRRSAHAGHPCEAVTRQKLKTLRSLAVTWMVTQPYWVAEIRIDVIGISLAVTPPDITHMRNVCPS